MRKCSLNRGIIIKFKRRQRARSLALKILLILFFRHREKERLSEKPSGIFVEK
jgi:hypothetical protein